MFSLKSKRLCLFYSVTESHHPNKKFSVERARSDKEAICTITKPESKKKKKK